jgi:hypothetical protein
MTTKEITQAIRDHWSQDRIRAMDRLETAQSMITAAIKAVREDQMTVATMKAEAAKISCEMAVQGSINAVLLAAMEAA